MKRLVFQNARVAVVVALLLSTSACAKRPQLVGGDDSPQRRAAIDGCVKLGDEAKGNGRLSDTVKRGALGGAASAAAGGGAAAVGNSLGGNYNVGGSVGISAAAGLIGNTVLALADRDVDAQYAQFVEQCLVKKGFRTAAWS